MNNQGITEQYTEDREGRTAKAIEKQTARLPSDIFLWSALGALGAGLLLQMRDRRNAGVVISQVAPVLLIMGLYNKLVKLAGSERHEVV